VLKVLVLKLFALLACLSALSCSGSTDLLTPEADTARIPLASWSVTQDFGVWNEGFGGYHLAEDAAARPGDEVYVLADGVVKAILTAPEVSGYGGVLIVEHNFGGEYVTSLYGHVSRRMGFPVARGDRVDRGQVVAYIAADDEDGGAWGPHLHFGIRTGRFSDTEQICGVWLYVGYTRECAGMTHEGYRDLWLDPSDFVVSHGGDVPLPEPN
jgi:murein DD-endopeptidase MepM/ murein hydrolase activator NlpD